jgi:hypothetical protein
MARARTKLNFDAVAGANLMTARVSPSDVVGDWLLNLAEKANPRMPKYGLPISRAKGDAAVTGTPISGENVRLPAKPAAQPDARAGQLASESNTPSVYAISGWLSSITALLQVDNAAPRKRHDFTEYDE